MLLPDVALQPPSVSPPSLCASARLRRAPKAVFSLWPGWLVVVLFMAAADAAIQAYPCSRSRLSSTLESSSSIVGFCFEQHMSNCLHPPLPAHVRT
eukprot:6193270-Pleurochrysis_carterae.AAC.2